MLIIYSALFWTLGYRAEGYSPVLGAHSLFRGNEQMNKLIITLSVVIKVYTVNKFGKHLHFTSILKLDSK